MEKPKEYHPKYQRYVLGVQSSGMTTLLRTLGLTGIGYMLAHNTVFRRNKTTIPLRILFVVPIFGAAYGWNLQLENTSVLATLRNNAKEVAHQEALGKTID